MHMQSILDIISVSYTHLDVYKRQVAVIDEFKAGTYGGKEFKTQEDVVNYYKECYDYTKTLTAEYKLGTMRNNGFAKPDSAHCGFCRNIIHIRCV